MKNKIIGTIVEIGQVETFQSGFTKRLLVVDDGRDRANTVPLAFTRDSTAKLDAFNVGDRVEVDYFVNGRAWDGPNGRKYFVDLAAHEIRKAGALNAPAALHATPSPSAPSKIVYMETATRKDVFAAWQAKNGIDANEMVQQLNDRNSAFTALRMRLFPALKWGQYVDGSKELAALVNEITGAKQDRAPETYEATANDPEDIPF